jgi:transcriptional regulator with XRE-family HTH domain
MDGAEVKSRRKALGLSQAEFGAKLGLSGDFIGRVERGAEPITPRTAAAVRALKPAPLDRQPKLKDQLEREIEKALIEAGIDFVTDDGGGTESRLDFYLPQFDVSIEVKRFYTARTGDQLARAANVIVAQGERAVRLLAMAIRSGDFMYAA